MPNAIAPGEELKQLQADLENNQAAAAAIKARIADLTRTAGDIEQKNKDFEKAAAATAKTAEQLTEFFECKKKVLEQKVAKDDIKAKKALAEGERKKKEDAAETAAKIVREQKEPALAAAKAKTAAKQKTFDEVAGRRARNAEILKELEALRAAVEKQTDNPSRAYFLLLVMKDRLDELKLTKPADYAAELNAAGAELAEAVKQQRAAEQGLEQAKATEKQTAQAYQDAKAKFLENALATIPAGTTSTGSGDNAPDAGGNTPADPGGNTPADAGGNTPADPAGDASPDPAGGDAPPDAGGNAPAPS